MNNQFNLNVYKPMESFIGKKDNFDTLLPIYDSTSTIDAIKTYFTGHCKKRYTSSATELLGKNAVDIFKNYQIYYDWLFSSYYISNGGFDGISFSFDDDFVINKVVYGRVTDYKKLMEKVKEYAKLKCFGVKLNRHGNLKGIYYSLELVDKKPKEPYVNLVSRSTLGNNSIDKLIKL